MLNKIECATGFSITRKNLFSFINHFFTFLENTEIKPLDNLENLIGQKYRVSEETNDKIIINKIEANGYGFVPAIQYVTYRKANNQTFPLVPLKIMVIKDKEDKPFYRVAITASFCPKLYILSSFNTFGSVYYRNLSFDKKKVFNELQKLRNSLRSSVSHVK